LHPVIVHPAHPAQEALVQVARQMARVRRVRLMGLTVGVIGRVLLATGTMAEPVARQMGYLVVHPAQRQATPAGRPAVAAVQLGMMKTLTIQVILGQQAALLVAAVTHL
jgi:threonine dehydratase